VIPWDQPDADPVGDIKAAVKRMREQPPVQYPLILPARMKEAYISLYGEPIEGTVVWS
jgi:hypothetical protein